MKFITMLLCATVFVLTATTSYAQKDKNNKTSTTKTDTKTNGKGNGKPDPKATGKTDPKANGKTDSKATAKANADARLASINGLSRDEKNTMTKCPLHGSHMPLSDNYRANASDFSESEGHPFAKQLNYRRYCPKCTNVLIKEERAARKREQEMRCSETFGRCGIHNVQLTCNPDYSPMDYEKVPNQEFPSAQQYKFKYQCKTCTKLHEKAQKDKEKATATNQ